MESTNRAVVRLTEPHTEHTDAGAVDWPPLLQWLEDAVTTVVGKNGGSSRGAGLPLNTEALTLLTHIDTRLKLMREALHQRTTGNRIADTRTVWATAQTERAGGRIDDPQWETITDEFPDWVMRIEAEDDRPRKMELTVPCPRCEKRWVEDADGNRVAAVRVEFKPGGAPVAECRNTDCAAIWAGWTDIAKLGFTIGAEQDTAVLAACGIDTHTLLANTVPS